MSSWFLFWIAFIFFLVAPIGYGWGYRGWGPPYPRYIQRRRGQRAAAAGSAAAFDHHSWGWGGDFLWAMLFLGMFWFAMAHWWG